MSSSCGQEQKPVLYCGTAGEIEKETRYLVYELMPRGLPFVGSSCLKVVWHGCMMQTGDVEAKLRQSRAWLEKQKLDTL